MTKYEYTVMGGPISGVDVIVSPHLRETDIHLFPRQRKIICGNLAHLRYQITKAQVVMDIRADLERNLDAFAKRVGVDRSTMSE